MRTTDVIYNTAGLPFAPLYISINIDVFRVFSINNPVNPKTGKLSAFVYSATEYLLPSMNAIMLENNFSMHDLLIMTALLPITPGV